ncbi:hypothetical protein SAMN05192558_10349 [Actinokineospora alba]|uniref:Subtilisin inhibitor-like n=1 Tax=Actinokineospora alba TaxID=504798 RepID=A0A1H0JE56_9PSEU|nr:hypothetical protein [Actinokineospora alba]TDP68328.1 hypothetical protein C8E96_3893 [Actinokineospora alba]SDH76753.1 hypothetical protein SAMN05421871_1024 [Actinokineospora alba]SDO41872.1 hypothetical protein SAMN05192558_10349 [Actinokineospora alba]
MNRIGTVLGAGALFVALAACGTSDRSPEIQPAPSTAPVGQPGRTPPADAKPVAGPQLDGSALPAEFPTKVWTESGGKTLGATAQEGGCGKASAEVAEQSAAKVVLVLVETTPANAEICTMDIRFPTVTAELDQPLGERKVVLRAEQRKS